MQNNYYYLKLLSKQLNEKIVNKFVIQCFSQNKDELVVQFGSDNDGNIPFYLQANLSPNFTCLYIPTNYQRARNNSIDLFDLIIGKKVLSVYQHINERAFTLYLSSDIQLCYKMFGNKANVLLFEKRNLIQTFKSNLKSDLQITYELLDRKLDLSFNNFQRNNYDITKTIPTIGSANVKLLLQKYNLNKNTESIDYQYLWVFLNEEISENNLQKIYILLNNEIPKLSLWIEAGNHYEEFDEAISALNRFYQLYSKISGISLEKQSILAFVTSQIKKLRTSIQEINNRLEALQTNIKNDEIGHIIMANIHQIKPNSESCVLFDFYRNQNITIKLKKDVSPQKNAENYYRKSKNESLEIENLKSKISEKKEKIKSLENHKEQINEITDIKVLRIYLKTNTLLKTQEVSASENPFKVVIFENFEIWIGKNAQNNDLLTQQYAKKDDLWLHARDVAGSHVVIKQQAGKPFPKTVIERAAQLAAFYSKRKTDTVCNVIVTPKKFVRKAKNMAAGKVIIEKETTVLVTPAGP